MDCSICCESFNKSIRQEVKCPYCNFSQCLKCFKTYLIGSVKSEPECMSCHRELSLDFISEVTPKIFHNDEYRKKRANMLLSQERSLLPASQHLVEQHNEENRRKTLINELLKEQKNLRQRLKDIQEEIRKLDLQNYTSEPEKERKKFIMGCPNENCRGFLSQSWKCGTCQSYVCSKCRVVKGARDDQEHVCDPDAVATAKLLQNDTKPCPNCTVPIFKISGCSQMFCVECHTAFDWNSGKIDTGIIHNPHFYQLQRDRNGGVAPRVPGDIPMCGGMPWHDTVRLILTQRQQKFKYWENCHRMVAHIRQTVLNRYPVRIGMLDNSDLRVQFLINEIDEDTWMRQLKIRQKKSEKDRAIHQLLELIMVSLTDIFITFVQGTTKNLENEVEVLRNYVNKEFHKIFVRYNNKTLWIKEDWIFK
jgi:hypothetical protein